MSDPWVLKTQHWLNQTYKHHAQWVSVAETGNTGWSTMGALTRALQIELGIATLSPSFGPTTLAELNSQFGDIGLGDYPGSNINKIIQGGGYCKGYNTANGDLTGDFDAQTRSAVISMRSDVGLPSTPATMTPKLFKGLLTMDAWKLIGGGTSAVREAQQALNGRYIGHPNFFVGPTDGLYGRQVQVQLMYAIQYEGGVAGANGNFGPGTQNAVRNNGVFGLGYTDGSGYWCHLFQAALRFNGHPSTPFTGVFDAATQQQMQQFQDFVGIANTAGATFTTWASLLVSNGDPARPATGADASTAIDVSRLNTLQSQGYQHFGRYLTNTPWPTDLDKCIKRNELELIHHYGGRVWPIFQTGGAEIAHFTPKRGREVSEEAANAAWAYRIPNNSIIYFSVDFDALDEQVTNLILPYFQAVAANIGSWGQSSYRVGIYAPRNTCQRVADAGYSVSSFVSDMSTEFSGNKGFLMPDNWAFDQFHELNVGSGPGLIRIDRNVVSGRDLGFGTLAPPNGVGNDPLIPSSNFNTFEAAWFNWCKTHADSAEQSDRMDDNRAAVRDLVRDNDSHITYLAETYGVYKALVMAPLIWESMCLKFDDQVADLAVRSYYEMKEAGLTPPSNLRDDSSTGPCQIFARTAIEARNWARSKGYISDGPYDPDKWQDVWLVWQAMNTNVETNIETALFYCMSLANTLPEVAVPPVLLRQATPSDLIRVYTSYNGSNTEPSDYAMKYGRSKTQLHYLIRKFHETYRA